MDRHFTHLHLHTEFSLLDGAISLDKLIDFGKRNEFKALAISDHGNIFGAVKFFQMSKAAKIKPVLAMEAYFSPDVNIKNVEEKYYHLILIVQNEIGYKNLCKLISFSYKQGFYFKPRIDYKILEQYSEGLIVTTACLGGHIPSLLMRDKFEEANLKIDWFLKHFGPERFYFEVQPTDQKEQKILNEKLFYLAEKRGIQCVAAGDCHYPTLQDREAHEVMLAIQTHHKITDPDRFSFGDCRAYMRTANEMLKEFQGNEQAVWNSGKIADMCNFDFPTGKLFFPTFEIPKNYDQASYFEYICYQGLEQLFQDERIDLKEKDKYQARLKIELDLIIKVGFVGYFLVVSDFIKWAKENDIPVGPGRGSAAGSLVAWSLSITDIDPIKYNLLFERFLNPERVSMPDIDIDFCIEGRDKVIQYVKDRYGHDKVCQIITFGTMLAKGVIKDVARALGFPFEDANALTSLIPDQLKITLNQAFEQEPKFKELIENNSSIAKLFDIASRLEGITRHASKHAAGIVISPDPIDEVLPVYIPPKTEDLVTQYAMTELESLGFLKMDFLGLKNLTLIKKTLNLIELKRGIKIDINKLDFEDKKTFDLLSLGNTSGVFQLESDGIKDVLRKLKPNCFEDIIAVNALYRPGPLGSGMVDDFVERKNGRQKIIYLFDILEDVLKETYGVIVYQEQVMKIASCIAGYTLGQSDILRRAMGKKKAEVMAEQRAFFVEGAIKNKFDEKKAGELFDLMAYFAGYGFNKSHSAAYALIAYQTAYLKANFQEEFMACLISLESHDAEKMAFYIQEARNMKIDILAPCVNKSGIDFTVIENKILFGLQGIKNVGAAAVENIIAERLKNDFKDILDFCKRIDLRVCNKRVLESLICSGALDCFSGFRAQKFNEISKIIDISAQIKKELSTGQMGLFGFFEPNEDNEIETGYNFQMIEDWNDSFKLEKEKEVLGIYLSAKPLDAYANFYKIFDIKYFSDNISKNVSNGLYLGTILQSKLVTTKKGDKMAFVYMEDSCSKAEIVVFPKLYARIKEWLDQYQTFLLRGASENVDGVIKIKADMIVPVDLIWQENIFSKFKIFIDNNFWCSNNYLENLSLIKSQIVLGDTPLEIDFEDSDKKLRIICSSKIRITKELVDKILDDNNINIQILI